MLKHVGRIATSKRKVVVAYRVLPGEPDYCVVITTENLEAGDHDTLMKTVESSTAQEANDFATVMMRTQLSDGSNMLARFHTTGKMVKTKTSDVEMTPNRNTVIRLNELNEAIAQQQGVTVADLAVKGPDGQTVQPASAEPAITASEMAAESVGTETASADGVLTDEALAAQYRSQADAMYKEAKRLREQAEELVPTKKKAATKKTVQSA